MPSQAITVNVDTSAVMGVLVPFKDEILAAVDELDAMASCMHCRDRVEAVRALFATAVATMEAAQPPTEHAPC